MKRIVSILLAFLPLFAMAQMVEPVKWSGETVGDSVRIKAQIEPGWHMNIIEFGEREFDEEYADSFVISAPSNSIFPPVTVYSGLPITVSPRVDFPAPLGPMSTCVLPLSIESETP